MLVQGPSSADVKWILGCPAPVIVIPVCIRMTLARVSLRDKISTVQTISSKKSYNFSTNKYANAVRAGRSQSFLKLITLGKYILKNPSVEKGGEKN